MGCLRPRNELNLLIPRGGCSGSERRTVQQPLTPPIQCGEFLQKNSLQLSHPTSHYLFTAAHLRQGAARMPHGAARNTTIKAQNLHARVVASAAPCRIDGLPCVA
jgi:hypothetical protein